MKKRVFYTELAYLTGLLLLSLGSALMTYSDFGVSMVVAPAYLLHLKLSEFVPFFSFGMAEYTLQAVILLVMIGILRSVKLSYFFSFVTAVLYGLFLDAWLILLGLIPNETLPLQIIVFVIGMLLCSFSISLLFRTYIPPEVYELFVSEVSKRFSFNIHKFKTVYDCASLLISVVLSIVFFGIWPLHGIGIGTVICAFLNGTLIAFFTKITDKVWVFEDKFSFAKHFKD